MSENLEPLGLVDLAAALADVEHHRGNRLKEGEEPAEVNLEAAGRALKEVITYLELHSLPRKSLVLLLGDTLALSAGAEPSAILRPRPTKHRRPDSPVIDGAKGRIAAVMEYCQKYQGRSRTDAAAWVARHLPNGLNGRDRPSPPTVDGWLSRWGGDSGAELGAGRSGYLAMRELLAQRRPGDEGLKIVLELVSK